MKAMNLKPMAMSLLVALTMSACGPQNKESEKSNRKVEINAVTMNAEELADAAEQLVTPYTFMLADSTAQAALAKDPKNEKAKVVRAIVAPLMAFKGIATRLKPAVREYGNMKEWERGVKGIPNSPAKKFLLAGKEDIKTVKDLQNWFDEVKDGFGKLRKAMKEYPNQELTIYVNPYLTQETLESKADESCKVIERTHDGEKTVEFDCDYEEAFQVKLNMADYMVVGQAAGGYELFLGLYNTFSLEGLETIPQDGKERSLEEILGQLPAVGKVRNKQNLRFLKEYGTDLISSVRWAQKYQRQLCPRGTEATNQRPGYLAKDGLCVNIDQDGEKNLQLATNLLKGIVKVDLDINDRIRPTNINLAGFLQNPISDIRILLPARTDKCGNPVSFKDKTFGGLFPDGDVEQLIQKRDCE